MNNFFINDKGQAQALTTVKLTKKDFEKSNHIGVYWLGGGGAMINSYGTVIMIDPLLKGFDMPLLIDLAPVTKEVHASHYVASLMKEECGVDNNILSVSIGG